MLLKKIKLLEDLLDVDENDVGFYGSIMKRKNPNPSNEEVFSMVDVIPSNAKLKLKNTIIQSLIPQTMTTTTTTEKEERVRGSGWYRGKIDPVIHPLAAIKQPRAVVEEEDRIYLELIRKEWEDTFLVEGPCSNNTKCIGHQLPTIHDWPKEEPGFSLRPFQTPSGAVFNNKCILCIRAEVTEKWLGLYSNGQQPSPSIIIPWRNSLDDYRESDFIIIDFESNFLGVSDSFIYFSFTKYCFVSPGKVAWRASHCFYSNVRFV